VVCTYRLEKKDPYRTRLTMGGNLVNYPDDCGTPTADILTVKLLLNSIISTKNAKFMTIDIKDFYLMTPMKRYEYFRMNIALFPRDIIEEFNLLEKVDHDGNVFCEV
jgi:CO/xanthine dehydrogenase FAD-binding subunit